MIKNLKANFRGKRNYLHSTTVINHIYVNNIKFKEIKFHNMAKNQIEFSKDKKNNIFGEIYLSDDKENENVIYMNETDNPITMFEEFAEDEIISMISQKDNRLIFNTLTKKFTFFDITIIMIKHLNYIQYPSKKKWLAGSLKLLNDKIDFFPKYEIIVDIEKFITGKFSNNIIYYNSLKVAECKFFLV